jgi:Fe-Mn family superoxide dismutase
MIPEEKILIPDMREVYMSTHYPFVNEPLPYAYDALEPYIDEKTMHLHHDKHLQTYIDNLNKILKDYPELQSWSLEHLLYDLASLPEKIQTGVRNNAGGVFNHQFYFTSLKNLSGKPSGALGQAIDEQFGSFENFKNQMKAAGLSVFGSGYAWLVVNALGKLDIITCANQDTPLPLELCPVLNLDVWEHAYYLKHQNLRADYIRDWFHVVNWDEAERRYEVALLDNLLRSGN